MRVEIKSASNFITNLLRMKLGKNVNSQRLEQYACKLEAMLGDHYQQHWFPDSPCKGSGYRCIRINHKMDPILSRAGSECGFDEETLKKLFPHELTMWIDPREVSYRIGENGSICVLYDGPISNETTKLPNGSWDRTPPRNITNKNNQEASSSSDSDDSCSPMSMSPPSPVFNRSAPSCKESLRETGFIMDPRNISFELSTYVAS